MNTEEFENKRWRHFQQSREFRHTAALAMTENGPVLDIGCGDGLFLSMLKEADITAEGVDISPEAIDRCRTQGLNAQVLDPSKPFPYADKSFGTVVLLDVLEHVYDPISLLKESARVALKDVIVSVPNFSSLPARLQVIRGLVPENNVPGKGHVYWFTKKVLEDIADEAGLVLTELRMNTFGIASRMHIPLGLWEGGLALSFIAKLTKP